MDLYETSDRIYRSIKRNGSRLVVIAPDGTVTSKISFDKAAHSILKHEPQRVVGIYDGRITPEELTSDIVWCLERLGVSHE